MNQPKPRNWYYKILRVAMRELSMSEDTYRDLLGNFGATIHNGKLSATTMNIPQLEQMLEHMKRCGFKPKSNKQLSPKDKQIWLIKKFWNTLYKAGSMRNPYSEATITKFAFRVTGVNNINWATPLGLAKTIEALKGIAKRDRVQL